MTLAEYTHTVAVAEADEARRARVSAVRAAVNYMAGPGADDDLFGKLLRCSIKRAVRYERAVRNLAKTARDLSMEKKNDIR